LRWQRRRLSNSYRAKGSSEQQNVGLGLVRSVVLPSSALLDTQVAPLELSQSSVLGEVSGVILGEDDVSVLVLAVLVLLRVFNLLRRTNSKRYVSNCVLVSAMHTHNTPYLGSHVR
jgi:hypothetical protein